MTDKLDELAQRLRADAAQAAMVPAEGVPPPDRQGPEGPPRHSSKAPVIFCGTGVPLPPAEKFQNPKSNVSYEETVEGARRAGAEARARGVNYWESPYRGGSLLQVTWKAGWDTADDDRELGLLRPENPETENPTSSDGTRYLTEQEQRTMDGALRRSVRIAPEPWEGCREFVEAEERRWSRLGGYLVADGHEPVGLTNLAAKVEARREATLAAMSGIKGKYPPFDPDWCQKPPALVKDGPYQGSTVAGRRVVNSWADHLEAIGASMSPEYRRTVEGPDYVPPQGALDGAELLRRLRRPDPEKALMMPGTVAGHTFEGVGSDARCGCGKYRDDLRGHDREWIGQHGHAHVGELTVHELNQIAEMWAADERVWDAVKGVSSGR